MELKIRYGIKDVAAQSVQFEINYPLLRKTVRKLTLQLAKVMLKSMLRSVLSSALAKDKERVKLLEQLSAQEEIRSKFSAFLDKKLQESVVAHFTNLLKEDGSINANVLRSCTVHTAKILNNRLIIKTLYIYCTCVANLNILPHSKLWETDTNYSKFFKTHKLLLSLLEIN